MRSLRSRPARLLEPASLLLILALAAYLRLARLADNPAWYTDEGTHVDIAQRLSAGARAISGAHAVHPARGADAAGR